MIKEWFDRFLYPTHRGRKLTSRLLIRLLKVALVCGLHHTPLLKLFPVTFFAIAEREDFNELP